VLKVIQVPKEVLVQQVLKEPQVTSDLKGLRELKEPKVVKGQQVR
jgi:hypothetical protein